MDKPNGIKNVGKIDIKISDRISVYPVFERINLGKPAPDSISAGKGVF